MADSSPQPENMHFDAVNGRWIEACPEPFWHRSWRTLWRWRPECWQCQRLFKDRAEWSEHWRSTHALTREA